MNTKQLILATLFIGLAGCVAAQNNDNVRGTIGKRVTTPHTPKAEAPSKNAQRMPASLSDAQRDGLHGEVEDVLAVMYEADSRSEKARRGDVLERLKTVYKQNGQRRTQSYLSNEEDLIFRTRYKHDGFGLITLEHILDPEDNVIGRTYYIYDADNVLTETYIEDEERQIESRMLIKYDAQGRVSQRSFNDHENNIFRREVYIYGANDNIERTVVFNAKGKKVQEYHFEYDEENLPTSSTLYDYNEEEPEITISIYEYTYDNQHNWVTRNEYQLNGEKKIPISVTERNIKYF